MCLSLMPFLWCGVRIARWNTDAEWHNGSVKMASVPTEKGKTMETYKIVMLIIVGALEIPAAIILVVGWVRACREARRRNDHDGK